MSRLFFALWPDTAVRDKLYRIAQTAHRNCSGRLMRSENLHQTLVFMGTVDAERIARVEAAAGGIAIESFKLDFGSTGYWRHNRIVWAAPNASPRPLTDLVLALEARLDKAGIGFDRRPYSPHITLVRNARLVEPLPNVSFTWEVGEFALVASGHCAGNAAYRVIARWPLAA